MIKSVVYSDISVEDLKKEYANEHSEFVEIDQMQVHYRDEGNGFPIILIHGTGSSLHTRYICLLQKVFLFELAIRSDLFF